MRETLIVDEVNGGLLIFASVARAEVYVEPIDVKNGEYVFYNGIGQRLEAKIVKDYRGVEHVKLLSDATVTYTEELKELIIEFLVGSGYERGVLTNLDLEGLLEIGLQFKTS